MGGTGGGTGYTAAADYLCDAHSLILNGFSHDTTPVAWDGITRANAEPYGKTSGDTYATNPSVLRFIIERGLTDKGGNPFAGARAFSVSDYLDEIKSFFEIFRDKVLNLDGATDWSTDLAQALAQDEVVIPTFDIQGLMSALVTTALAHSTSMVSDALSRATTDKAIVGTIQGTQLTSTTGAVNTLAGGASTLADTLITSVASRALALSDTMSAGIQTNGLADGAAVMADVKSDVDTTLSSEKSLAKGYGEDIVDQVSDGLAVAQEESLDALTAIRDNFTNSIEDFSEAITPDISAMLLTVYTEALSNTASIITAARTDAQSMIDSTLVTNLVDAYRTRAIRQHQRTVNSFTGGMADINAVNSSAFVIGLAILESDFDQDIRTYQAELEKELYMQGFKSYLESYSSNQAAYLDSFIRRFTVNAELYKSDMPIAAQMITSIFPEYLKVFITGYTEYFRNLVSLTQLQGEQVIQAKNLREQIALELARLHVTTAGNYTSISVEHLARMVSQELNSFMQLLETRQNATMQSLQTEFQDTVRMRMQEQALRTQFIDNTVSNLGSKRMQAMDIMRAASALITEINRISLVAQTEESDKNFEYGVKSAGWDLELFQLAGNILSSYSGSVIPTAGKPSRFQSALGGGLSGASVGLSGGGVPGAIFGGVGGLIAGFQS